MKLVLLCNDIVRLIPVWYIKLIAFSILIFVLGKSVSHSNVQLSSTCNEALIWLDISDITVMLFISTWGSSICFSFNFFGTVSSRFSMACFRE